MRKLLVSIFIVLASFPQFAVAQDAVSGATNTMVSKSVQIQNAPVSYEQKDAYVTSLEQTVEILNKTNEALNQRWTPLNVTLTALSVLFAVITILWGVVFAFGYVAVQGIREQKKLLVEESAKQKNELQDVISGFREEKDKISLEGKDLLAKLTDKKKTTAELETELVNFLQKSQKTIERLEDRAITSAPNYFNSLYAVSQGPFASGIKGESQNPSICDRCGAVFYEKPLRPWGDLTEMRRLSVYETTQPLKLRLGSIETLCRNCRESKS